MSFCSAEAQEPVALEMLWESVDPHEALHRFGFSNSGQAAMWVSSVLATSWGCGPRRCERIVISSLNALAWVRCDSTPHIAKWSVHRGRFDFLSEIARLTTWLHEQGIPVSAPIPSQSGAYRVEADGASIELQRVQAGDLLDVARPNQAFAGGETLARLHDALSRYPGASALTTEPTVSDAGEPRARIAAWLNEQSDGIPTEVREELRRRVADALPLDPGVQLVHRDYRSSNVIWYEGRVAAVLDFEEVGPDYRVVDLARAAAMLGTRFRDWRPTPSNLVADFIAGYKSARPLSEAEASWLRPLIAWQLLVTATGGWNPELWLAAADEQLRWSPSGNSRSAAHR